MESFLSLKSEARVNMRVIWCPIYGFCFTLPDFRGFFFETALSPLYLCHLHRLLITHNSLVEMYSVKKFENCIYIFFVFGCTVVAYPFLPSASVFINRVSTLVVS